MTLFSTIIARPAANQATLTATAYAPGPTDRARPRACATAFGAGPP